MNAKLLLKAFLLLTLCSFADPRLFAQAKTLETTTYSVFFESDKHALSAETVKTLQEVAADCANYSMPSIEIAAFADADGANDYNQRLSERRAKSVTDFLRKQGMASKQLTADARGETGEADEEDKKKSRRVDILVRHLVAPTDEDKTPIALAFAKMSKQNEQYFTQKNTEDVEIKGKNGSLVGIEKGSLQFADGTFPTGEVKFTLREAYNYSSMIENALATSSDGHLLETGGMVYIAAEADGKPLELVKGKTMNIQMPIINSLENNKGMELFYGETHEKTDAKTDGTKPITRINWKSTKQKVRSRSKLAKRVKWDKLPKPELPATNFAMICLPKFYEPSKPPHFPRELPNPALQKRSFLEKLLKSDAALVRDWNADKEARIATYDKKMEKYVQDSIHYYAVYLPDYKQRLSAFNLKLAEREQAYRRYVLAYARYDANAYLLEQMRFIEPFSAKNASGLASWFTYGYDVSRYRDLLLKGGSMVFNFDAVKQSDAVARAFGFPTGSLDTLKTHKKGEIKTIDDFAVNGVDKGADRADRYDYLVALAGRQVAKEHGIDSLFGKITQYIAITKAAAAQERAAAQLRYLQSVGDTTLNNAYMNGMESKQFGWINCDRFNADNSPKTQILADETAEQKHVKMFVLFKDMKAIMPMWQYNSHYVSEKIPVNKKIMVVAIKTEGNKIFVAKQDATTQSDLVVKLNYKEVALTDMKAALASVN